MNLSNGHKIQTMGRWTPDIILYSDLDSHFSGLECDSIEDAREKIAAAAKLGHYSLAIYQKVVE